MKYTASELKNITANATTVETYIYNFNNDSIHTDNVTYIGNGHFDNSEIDELPHDENGEVDVDVEIMDAEDYNNTIFANCGMRFEDVDSPVMNNSYMLRPFNKEKLDKSL